MQNDMQAYEEVTHMEVNGQLHTLASLTLSSSCLYPPLQGSLGGLQSQSTCFEEKVSCHFQELNPNSLIFHSAV